MRQLALVVALCFAFVVVGHADRCSDLCNKCRKSPRDICTCCEAENACYKNGRQTYGDADSKCKSLEGVGGSGDNYDNNQYFPAFNERDVGGGKSSKTYWTNFVVKVVENHKN
jgi:hypothetical protein